MIHVNKNIAVVKISLGFYTDIYMLGQGSVINSDRDIRGELDQRMEPSQTYHDLQGKPISLPQKFVIISVEIDSYFAEKAAKVAGYKYIALQPLIEHEQIMHSFRSKVTEASITALARI